MNILLSVLLENTKIRMTDSVNKVIQESNLPAYLIEGILSDILAEVRKQKNLELASDYATMNEENQKSEEDEKEGEE